MTRGIKRDLLAVRKRIDREIKGISSGYEGNGPNYRAGLSSEGYAGGYRDAIEDVMLAMNNVKPGDRFHFWQDFKEK